MKKNTSEIDQLFSDYLAVCNRALEANREAFPYKQIWDAAESFLGDRSVKLAVYDDRPQECYCLQMKDKKIETAEDCNRADPQDAWRVNLSYLQQVVENPDEYINHPARLDWDWLRNRMGI